MVSLERSTDKCNRWRYTYILLLFISLTAFLLRALPWKNFLGKDGELLFYGPDSYDHLRRITLGLAEFPRIPMFDSFYGYPLGTGFIWSPFFDYLLTGLSLIGGGTPAVVHSIGFWAAPVFGGITVLFLHYSAARLFGATAGAVAAAVLALLPGHILYTFVSELDHHAVEPLLALAVLMTVAALQEKPGKPRSRMTPWFRGALCFVAVILLWRGGVVFWAVAVGGVVLQLWALRKSDMQAAARLGRQGAFLCAAAALLLVPVCLGFGGASGSGMKFNVVSWFHVLLLASSSLLLYLLPHFDLQSKHKRKLAAVFLFVAAALLVIFGQKFLSGVFSGLVVVGRGDPWLDSISELRSMLFPSGDFALLHSVETMSLFYWISPLLFWRIFREWQRKGDLKLAIFLVWGAGLWLMPLFRERYVHLAALPVAICAGYAVELCREYLASRFGSISALSGSLLIMLLLLAPVSPFLARIPSVMLPIQEIADLPEALRYLREKTPATSHFSKPLQKPEYGVLSEWGLGAYICYLGQRPTVATNFGWETHGLFDSVAFLVTANPLLAGQILDENRVRFLLMSDISRSLQNFRRIAEQSKSPYMREILAEQFKPLASVYYRLYIQDGAAYTVGDLDLPALSGYRLVYETANGTYDPVAGMVSHYKVFEKVRGALLQGTTRAGTRVTLQLSLRTPNGRILAYRDWVYADRQGGYSFRLPYSTDGAGGSLVPLGSYAVYAGNGSLRVDVSEEEVSSGSKVRSK